MKFQKKVRSATRNLLRILAPSIRFAAYNALRGAFYAAGTAAFGAVIIWWGTYH